MKPSTPFEAARGKLSNGGLREQRWIALYSLTGCCRCETLATRGMANFQSVDHAKVMSYYELSSIINSELVRFVARVHSIQLNTSDIELRCPQSHHCHLRCDFGLSASTRLVEDNAFLQSSDLVEVVGFVDTVQTESSSTKLLCECLVLRNANGIDLDRYQQCLKLLEDMIS